MRRHVSIFLLIALHIWLAPRAHADLVVVTNQKSGVDRLTQQEVIFLFMGRWRLLPSGVQAHTIDQAIDSPERADFYRHLVNKEPAEIKAYWSRLIFSGASRPPYSAENHEELIRQINSHPGAISYIDRSQVDSRLHIVYEFPGAP